MGLKEIILAKVKEEITLDPMGLGYEGKTIPEIVKLLNDPVKKTRQVEEILPSRINQILLGVAYAPNVITETDII